ncbi:MAG: hypothetical protein AB9856_13090 [Cellulosilyticaceae bacterium]
MKFKEEIITNEKVWIGVLIVLSIFLLTTRNKTQYFIMGSGNGEKNKITLGIPKNKKKLHSKCCNKKV